MDYAELIGKSDNVTGAVAAFDTELALFSTGKKTASQQDPVSDSDGVQKFAEFSSPGIEEHYGEHDVVLCVGHSRNSRRHRSTSIEPVRRVWPQSLAPINPHTPDSLKEFYRSCLPTTTVLHSQPPLPHDQKTYYSRLTEGNHRHDERTQLRNPGEPSPRLVRDENAKFLEATNSYPDETQCWLPTEGSILENGETATVKHRTHTKPRSTGSSSLGIICSLNHPSQSDLCEKLVTPVAFPRSTTSFEKLPRSEQPCEILVESLPQDVIRSYHCTARPNVALDNTETHQPRSREDWCPESSCQVDRCQQHRCGENHCRNQRSENQCPENQCRENQCLEDQCQEKLQESRPQEAPAAVARKGSSRFIDVSSPCDNIPTSFFRVHPAAANIPRAVAQQAHHSSGRIAGFAESCNAVDRTAVDINNDRLSDGNSLDAWAVSLKEITLIREAGIGASSKVYHGWWRGSDVAVKKLHYTSNDDNVSKFQKEIQILLRLRHPNLVMLMGAAVRKPPYALITEFCEGGDLYSLLHNPKSSRHGVQKLTLCQKLKIALDVAKGVAFLHSASPPIIHRDLKSLNVLLFNRLRSPTDEPLAKVADFGLSTIKYERRNKACTNEGGGVGTLHWMAPELLTLPNTASQSYDEAVDAYAFGMVLYEIFYGKIPYMEFLRSSLPELRKYILQGARPTLYDTANCATPEAIRTLMLQCWSQDPSARPTLITAVQQLKKCQRLVRMRRQI